MAPRVTPKHWPRRAAQDKTVTQKRCILEFNAPPPHLEWGLICGKVWQSDVGYWYAASDASHAAPRQLQPVAAQSLCLLAAPPGRGAGSANITDLVSEGLAAPVTATWRSRTARSPLCTRVSSTRRSVSGGRKSEKEPRRSCLAPAPLNTAARACLLPNSR